MSEVNFVYLLECSDKSLYCGWTNKLEERVKMHNGEKGAKYTHSRRPVKLVYYEEYPSAHEARSREVHLKQLSREEKLSLIARAEEFREGVAVGKTVSLS